MRIAIVKLSALGDIVHAMVVLQFIKKYNQSISIDWIVDERFEGLLKHQRDINSIHLVRLKKAKEKKIFSVGLLGKDGGKAKNFTDLNIIVPSKSTARIQEMHIMIGHIACSIAEKEIFKL